MQTQVHGIYHWLLWQQNVYPLSCYSYCILLYFVLNQIFLAYLDRSEREINILCMEPHCYIGTILWVWFRVELKQDFSIKAHAIQLIT